MIVFNNLVSIINLYKQPQDKPKLKSFMRTSSPTKQQSPKKKSQKQKSNQDIFLHLLQLYKPSENKIKQNKVLHEIQDLYELLTEPPKNRTARILKKLKSELTQLKCFKIPPYNQQNTQFLQIFKRDTQNILNMAAPFIEMTHYKKGSIVQITGMKRESIKILLMGEAAVFQPVNYKAFRNCVMRIKNGEVNLGLVAVCAEKYQELLSADHEKKIQQIINQQSILEEQEQKAQNIKQQIQLRQSIQKSNKPSLPITQQSVNSPTSPLISVPFLSIPQSKPLTVNQCRTLLTKCGIIVPSLTPHTKSKKPMHGDLLTDKDQPLFIDQKIQYATSTVCETDCVFLEIGYDIAKEIIMLINNDRERPFIQSLLFKFQSLKYLQAKQYVTQEFMIIHEAQQQYTEQNLRSSNNQQNSKNISQSPKKSAIPIIKQLKVISSLNYQLPYTGELYLIISGAVTIIIDEIFQRKPSTIQYIISQKSLIPKQILHLYKNDIFGFQEIGKQKQCNLRYQVAMGSKLLKINNHIFKNHLYSVFGFKKQINTIIETRNSIISNILNKMQNNLQNQQIIRHNSITFSKQNQNNIKIKQFKSMQLNQNTNQIRQLKYMGYQNYDQVSNKIKEYFSIQSVNKPKQSLSPEIVKESGLGLQFSINLKKNQNEVIEIKDGWIQIRSKNGTLIRRKRIKQHQKNSLQEEQNPSKILSKHFSQQQSKQPAQLNPQKNLSYLNNNAIGHKNQGDTLLRKLGILSTKQIAQHNLKMVKRRPSKYQFDDLNKQAKQFKKIRQKSLSLPKLTHFYAKKQNRLFNILYKKTHL